MNLRRPTLRFTALRVAILFMTTLWIPWLLASSEPAADAVPVWIYNADSFKFWHTPQGEARGFYPILVSALNQRFNLNLQLRPISGSEIGQRFNTDAYGVYVGVLRTEQRARTKLLSSRLFDNEVVAASQTQQISTLEPLRHARVLFRENDATLASVKQRYPDLTFRSLREVASSDEAFRLLSENKADFYINDASEMENTARYYVISRPFPELRIPVVMAFSPDLRPLREQVNTLISEWFRSGKMRHLLEESKRDYLLSRITLSEAERDWLQQHHLQVWLPKNENYAPVIWREGQGYHGIALNMINDMRELLGMKVDVQFIDDYATALRNQQWPVRLLNITESKGDNLTQGQIGPTIPWHNAYYNLIGHPFLWDEESIRNQRIGVLTGSFAQTYLQRRFGEDVTIVNRASVDQLIAAIEDKEIDYILGDLSTLEAALRGNELFRGVLKVAGVTRSEFEIGPWVAPDHPLHNLLSQVQRLSSFRTQLERQEKPDTLPELTKNSWKMISVILLIASLFSLGMLVMMWRHMQKNRLVNRNIVQALEKVNRAHDDETGSHIQRVAKYCGMMARELGLPRRTVHDIEHFASLHDVGKIAVPDRILRKQGKLTPEEFSEMKLHVLKGWRVIQGLGLGHVAENMIHFHHEKWDGSGYPQGLRGEEIPVEARILALADVYDALRQKRIYKPAFSHEEACEVILAGNGRHFDPMLVQLFRRHHLAFQAIFDSMAD